jgi:hypothetical protein
VFRLKESNAPGENLRFAMTSASFADVGILHPEIARAESTTRAAGPGDGRSVMVFTGQVAHECESRRLDARGAHFLTGGRKVPKTQQTIINSTILDIIGVNYYIAGGRKNEPS